MTTTQIIKGRMAWMPAAKKIPMEERIKMGEELEGKIKQFLADGGEIEVLPPSGEGRLQSPVRIPTRSLVQA